MTPISMNTFIPALRATAAAVAVTLVAIPAAFADDHSTGLQKLLEAPSNFVAISEGAPGSVTFASMTGDTLAVQFLIPTHSGETFGEFVGTVDASGVFTGHGTLISDNGRGRSTPVTMTFQDDGTIVADFKDGSQGFGFMPTTMLRG